MVSLGVSPRSFMGEQCDIGGFLAFDVISGDIAIAGTRDMFVSCKIRKFPLLPIYKFTNGYFLLHFVSNRITVNVSFRES